MLGTELLKEQIANANSIKMLPIVSAEWNYNLFTPPYLTVAGSGSLITKGTQSGATVSSSTKTKAGFTVKQFTATGGKGKIAYNIPSLSGKAYKVITYIKTNAVNPVLISTHINNASNQHGSQSAEVNSFMWTKVETYVGSSTTISSFDYTLQATLVDGDTATFTLYFTDPEVYETTEFDYRYASLWPTDSPFTFFRPGESYVETGNANIPYPTNFRRINSVSSVTGYPQCSSVMYAPQTAAINPSKDVTMKHGMLSDISQYKYFVSDDTSRSLSAKWDSPIVSNKIVVKMQTSVSVPVVTITVNGTSIGSFTVDHPAGILVLYRNGSSWSTTKWATMPEFGSDGALAGTVSISSMTITQTASTIRSAYSAIGFGNNDFHRMHLIELSPRLEIDVSGLTQSTSYNQSLDNRSTAIPISSIDSNDASIELSNIPARLADNSPIPIFSNESALNATILAGILRKNVKLYLSSVIEEIDGQANGSYVPGGVVFSDSWSENDIKSSSVQCFDITKYLQTTPAPDHVSQYRPAFDVITDIFDFCGFSDYDYDSLYEICHDKNQPLDLAYYFCNSKEQTVFDAIRELFLAYQIGAFVDEYGVIKFISLSKIIRNTTPTVSISDRDILSDGFSLTTKAKPGKISIRYQQPIIKTSLPLDNVKRGEVLNSPSYTLTTSGDILWSQQSEDSVGFNYLSESMAIDDTEFNLAASDMIDIFHTFQTDYAGYALIEDEIVSFEYKKYRLQGGSPDRVVYVKNNTDLQAEINQYIKDSGATKVTIIPGGGILGEKNAKIVNVQRGLFGTRVASHEIIGATIGTKGLAQGVIPNNSSTILPDVGAAIVVNSRIGIQTS